MIIAERENYSQDDPYSPNNTNRYQEKDLGSPLDNSVNNDEDQDIYKKFSTEKDFGDDRTVEKKNDLNNNDPYPDDDELDFDDDETDLDDEIEDLNSDDDLDENDDFQEDDLDDDDDTDSTRPRNPSQF